MKKALIAALAALALALPSGAAARPSRVELQGSPPPAASGTVAGIGTFVGVVALVGAGFALQGRRRRVRVSPELERLRPIHESV